MTWLVTTAIMLAFVACAAAEPLTISACKYCKYCSHCDLCSSQCPCTEEFKIKNPKNMCDMCVHCKWCSLCSMCTAVCDGESTIGSGVAAVARFFGAKPIPDVPATHEIDDAHIDERIKKIKKEEL